MTSSLNLNEPLATIPQGLVDELGADFARIWLLGLDDLRKHGFASQLFIILSLTRLTLPFNRRFRLICSEICLSLTVTAAPHMLAKYIAKSTPPRIDPPLL